MAYASYKPNLATSRLQSGLIDVTEGAQSCLKFFYHMFGEHMGTLTVSVKDPQHQVVGRFSKSGINFPFLRIQTARLFRAGADDKN